jgi:dienelactone hydrolase
MKKLPIFQNNYIFVHLICLILVASCAKETQQKKTPDIIKKDNPVIENKQVDFRTSDEIIIKGDFYYLKDNYQKKEPLVILIHQFKSDRKQWRKDLIDSLVNCGIKVLTYDIRGHGESGKPNTDFMNLLTDREQAPKDLISIFKWCKEQNGIDSTRIGVLGTSIGASLAIYTRYYLGSKTIIGISGGKKTFEGLTGIDERTMGSGMAAKRISSVFFICGDKDNSYADEEKSIMETFILEPKESKIYDSDKHGKDLISQFPNINSLIINWFKKYL